MIDYRKCAVLTAIILFLLGLFFSADARADRLNPYADKEKTLRHSLFAEGNPARDLANDAAQQLAAQQEQQLAEQRARYDQEQQYVRQEQRPAMQQDPRSQPTKAADEPVVGFAEDGSVKVRSGNKKVDDSAQGYLNRKFENLLHTLWH